MFGRDEKVSSGRLTAVQYIILVVFLVLAYGLWRLQVVQSEFYGVAAPRFYARSCRRRGYDRSRPAS
jgi:cell division protein FtsI/penicillin-binding protein 2